MTERIYQLRESEYNELFEKAKLNDKEINGACREVLPRAWRVQNYH